MRKKSLAEKSIPVFSAAFGALLATYLSDAVGATLILIITACILFVYEMIEQVSDTNKS